MFVSDPANGEVPAKKKRVLTEEQKARKAVTNKAWAEANKEYRKASHKAWVEANKEHRKAQQKAWHKRKREGPTEEAMLFHVEKCARNSIRSDRHNKRPFSSVADIAAYLRPFPTHCPKTGVLLNYRGTGTKHKSNPNAASIDEIVIGLGHVPGNTRIVAWRFNELRKSGTSEEFRILYEDALEIERQIQAAANDAGPEL